MSQAQILIEVDDATGATWITTSGDGKAMESVDYIMSLVNEDQADNLKGVENVTLN